MGEEKPSLFGKKGHKFEASGDFAEHLEGDERRKKIPPETVVERLGLTGKETVVDLGAGLGFFAIPLSKRASEVLAIDSEPKMLAMLSERMLKSGIENIRLVLGDIGSLPFADGSVDHVFGAFIYHEVPDQSRLIRECARVLRPSGKLTVVDFQKRFTGDGPPIWVKKSPSHVERTSSPWFSLVDRDDSRVYYQLSLVKK